MRGPNRTDDHSAGPPFPVGRVAPLVLAVTLLYLGNQMVGVALPTEIIRRGGDVGDVGLLVAAATAATLVGRASAPHIAARIGDRWAMTWSAATVSIGAIVLRRARGLGGLILARSLHSAAFGLPSSAYLWAIGNEVSREQRPRAMAIALLAMPLALALGPWMSLDVLGADLQVVTLVAFGVAAVAASLFAATARGGDRHSECTPPALQRLPVPVPPTRQPGAALRPGVVAAAGTALGVTDGLLLDFVPVLAEERDLATPGRGFIVYALAVVLGQLVIARRIPAHHMHSLSMIGLGLTAAGLVAVGGAGTSLQLAGGMAMSGLGFALTQTGLSSIAAAEPRTASRWITRLWLSVDAGRGVGLALLGRLVRQRSVGLAYRWAAGYAMVWIVVLLGG